MMVWRASTAILAAGLVIGAAKAAPAEGHGTGMMAPGMMGQMQGMGPGGPMMGPGMREPGQTAPGMMGPGMMGQMPGMMGQGAMWHMGPHMMSPDEMQEMMEHMGGMMGQGTGPGMIEPDMGPGMGGWSGLEGRRVVPMLQLSTDDVRGFFERHLAALGNERLKVGKVEALGDDTITADVTTVDDSLVERFEVDRRTGVISPTG